MSYPFELCRCIHLRATHVAGRGACTACGPTHCASFTAPGADRLLPGGGAVVTVPAIELAQPKPVSVVLIVEAHLKAIEQVIAVTPSESTEELEQIRQRLIDLANKALYRKALECEGWSARWCGLCGDCTCGVDYEHGGWHIDCPLHGNASEHAAKAD